VINGRQGLGVSGREYPGRPLVGVGIVLLKPDAVLLIRRAKPPAAGTWALPGGAQKLGEAAEMTARRELLEETGLEAGPLQLICHVDSIHRDDAGLVQYHYTILDFVAPWIGGTPVAGGDVTDAVFAPLESLAPYALWSEAHRVIDLGRTLVSFGDDVMPTVFRD
jgi:ADP-ribose pyrophosphatase YjhB (NUDIX family)